jgi:hypothetical protein
VIGDPLLQVNNQALSLLLHCYVVPVSDMSRRLADARVLSCQAIICKAEKLTGEGLDEGCGGPSTLRLHCKLGNEYCVADKICGKRQACGIS